MYGIFVLWLQLAVIVALYLVIYYCWCLSEKKNSTRYSTVYGDNLSGDIICVLLSVQVSCSVLLACSMQTEHCNRRVVAVVANLKLIPEAECSVVLSDAMIQILV